MAAKKDSQLGLRATVHASREDVLVALARAADVLGNHATATTNGNKVTVAIRPGLVRAMSPTSPVVGMTVTEDASGSVCTVGVGIDAYRTSQTKFMLLIPLGPKLLVGKSSYLNLLTSVEQELRAVDRGKLQLTRTGAA